MKASFKPKTDSIPRRKIQQTNAIGQQLASSGKDQDIGNENFIFKSIGEVSNGSELCRHCNQNLRIYLDIESNSCKNCGAVVDSHNIDLQSSSFSEKQSGFYVNESATRSNTNIQTLIRWGWSNSSANVNKSKTKKRGNFDLEGSTDQRSIFRSLEDQYYRNEFNSVKDSNNAVSRLLSLQAHAERANFLSKLALTKRLPNGKFFKMGQEGKLVGAACLCIAVRESGSSMELAKISKVMKVSTHVLGSVYKRVKRHLGYKSEVIETSVTATNIVSSLYAEVNRQSLGPSISYGNKKREFQPGSNTSSPLLIGLEAPTIKKFSATLSWCGSSRLTKMAVRLFNVCKDLCLTIGKNTSQVIGSAVLVAIYISHFNFTGQVLNISSKINENELYIFLSEICVCSTTSLRGNVSMMLSMIAKITSNYKWLFGEIPNDHTCILVAEKVLDFYEKLKHLDNRSSPETGSSSLKKSIDKITCPGVDETELSPEPFEIFRSMTNLEKRVSSGDLGGNELAEFTTKKSALQKRKLASIQGIENLGFQDDTNLLHVSNHSNQNLRQKQKIGSEAHDINNGGCTSNSSNDSNDSNIFLTKIDKSINPASFIRVQELIKKRYAGFNNRLEAFGINYKTNTGCDSTQSTNAKIPICRNEKEKDQDFKDYKARLDCVEKIREKLQKYEAISEVDLLVALYFLGCQVESVISLGAHTLYDILGSKMRNFVGPERNLDAPELTDVDLPETEVDLYIK